MLTLPDSQLTVSFVISTRNRRDELLHTLGEIRQCGLSREAYEIIVVDNDSTDGTADSVTIAFPEARVIRLLVNRGSCAKNAAIARSRGRFVVFLDDDSYPRPGSISRMIAHFDREPDLGAAVFTVELPDLSRECSAYPDIFIGCGTGFRSRALAHVGGLPDDFFMQAEEYDLSLRLIDAGWRVRAFDDLNVSHLKSPTARRSSRTMRLDVRNNLMLATRYFPREWIGPFIGDWLSRYYRIAAKKRQRTAFVRGAIQGMVATMRADHRRPISRDAFEHFTRIRQIESRMAEARRGFDLQSVLFVDIGKNILPYWMAAKKLGIKVVAIADSRLAAERHRNFATYRGVPIVNDDEARSFAFDAVVISNNSPVHATMRRDFWRGFDGRPVIDLFENETLPRHTTRACAA